MASQKGVNPFAKNAASPKGGPPPKKGPPKKGKKEADAKQEQPTRMNSFDRE